jgi:hypothetical protein
MLGADCSDENAQRLEGATVDSAVGNRTPLSSAVHARLIRRPKSSTALTQRSDHADNPLQLADAIHALPRDGMNFNGLRSEVRTGPFHLTKIGLNAIMKLFDFCSPTPPSFQTARTGSGDQVRRLVPPDGARWCPRSVDHLHRRPPLKCKKATLNWRRLVR